MPGQTSSIRANIRAGVRGAVLGDRIPPDGNSIPSPGGLLAWYDAQNINLLNNVGILDADPVGTWKNAAPTGAAYDLLQATAGQRPAFRKIAAAGKINNLSAIESVGAKSLQSSAFTLAPQPLTWALVWRNTAVGTQLVASGNAPNVNQFNTAVTAFSLYAGTSQNPGFAYAANTWETFIVRYDGATSTATLNGVTVSGFGTLGTFGIDLITLFWNAANTGGADMIGLIAECAIWTAAPTHAEITAYFNAKYGITPQ